MAELIVYADKGYYSSTATGSFQENNATINLSTQWGNSAVPYGAFLFDTNILKYKKGISLITLSFKFTIGYTTTMSGYILLNSNITQSGTKYALFGARGEQGNQTQIINVGIPINSTSLIEIEKGINVFPNFYINIPNNNNAATFIAVDGVKSAYKPRLIVTHADSTPKPPSALQPNNVNKQPMLPIELVWLYNPYVPENVEPEILVSSELMYRLNNGAWETKPINNDVCRYLFLAKTFKQGDAIEWKVRTQALYNGWSNWSDVAKFVCAPTPPLKSLLIYPVSVTVPGGNSIGLEYRYMSENDNKPSGFDVMYKAEKDLSWKTGHTKERIFIIDGYEESTYVYWKVRAYGEFNDIGAWSDEANFFVSGRPRKPVITEISGGSKPIITWSGENIKVYEIEILCHDKIVYESGKLPFYNNNIYMSNVFLKDDMYLSKIRITNDFGFESNWGELPFVIKTTSPIKPTLDIDDNDYYFIKLYFESVSYKTYIYRSLAVKDDFAMIALVDNDKKEYDDYTANSGVRYKYFIRSVAEDNAFSDSDLKTGILWFNETIISSRSDLEKMLIFKYSLNGNVSKNETVSTEKSYHELLGRKYPVVEFGDTAKNEFSFNYYCTFKQFEDLKTLEGEICFLRDMHVGSFTCAISNIQKTKNDYTFKGYIVSFTVTRLNEPVNEVL